MRDFSHLMCAGGWDAIKITEKGNSGRQPHFNSVDVKANRVVWVALLLMLELSMKTSTRLVCDLENPLKFIDAYY